MTKGLSIDDHGLKPPTPVPSPMTPAWMQLAIALVTIIVTATLAYANLAARLAVLEAKMDLILQSMHLMVQR